MGNEGRKYFPFIFSLFMFILFCNLLGLLPYAFTVTSHIVVTAAMAMFVFVGSRSSASSGTASTSSPVRAPGRADVAGSVMIPIEILSYFIRPISLSVRLFANMVAGHVMLAVIGGFVVAMGVWFGWIPLAFVTVLFGLELLIACLQAYVFTILTCIYLHDAIHLH